MKKITLILILEIILIIIFAFILFNQTQKTTSTKPKPDQTQVSSSTTSSIKQDIYAPILMYHHIGKKDPQDSYYVSPETFDQQMKWLKDNDFRVVTYMDYYKNRTEGIALPSKPVVITFDDGVLDHFTQAFPILQKYGFTGLFFIKTNFVGQTGYMNWEQIIEMQKAGMEIGSHSANHDNMANMDIGSADRELSLSKKTLEQKLGGKIDFFSYPGGGLSDQIAKEVKSQGYLSALTTHHEVYHKASEDLFKVGRIHIDDEMESFENWVQGIDLK
ncbi:MAG: polysaccharide deacetylase family protein [Candidatus Berkelbacteria bacterium]|nr:polysaccharide deacetylase family protein [Candidatus Berkelbacteria bacterium]